MTIQPAVHIQQIEEALEERKGADRRSQRTKQTSDTDDRRQQDRRDDQPESVKH